MNMTRYRNLVLIPWLAVPVILASYLLLWNKMPDQIAVHFTLSGRPVAWMSRGYSLFFHLMALLIVLSISSYRLLGHENNGLRRPLVRHYFAALALTTIFLVLLLYNTR